MPIILDNYEVPEKGHVEVKVSFEIKVTAEEARRKANRWLLEEVSHLIGADSPTLVVGQRAVWRVPAYITFPTIGRAGEVGAVDADVETGELDNSSDCKAEIERQAKEIAAKLPVVFTPREVPPEFTPKHIPQAPKLILPDDDEPQTAL